MTSDGAGGRPTGPHRAMPHIRSLPWNDLFGEFFEYKLVLYPVLYSKNSQGYGECQVPGVPAALGRPGSGGAPGVPAMKLRWTPASCQVPVSCTRASVARVASGMGCPW